MGNAVLARRSSWPLSAVIVVRKVQPLSPRNRRWTHRGGLSYTLVTARLLIVALGRYRLMHSTAPPDMHSGMFLVEPPVPVGTEFANARSIGR